jgi:hypothetical protein
MSDIPVDGMTRVSWVPTIANIAAPTTTELNAGLILTFLITRDGLMGFEPTTAKVDNSSIGDIFDISTTGTDSFADSGFRLKKQTGTDTAYTTLVKGTAGYVVIRRDIDRNTAYASAQKLEVYPAVCGRRKRLAPEKDTVTRYEVPIFITSEPNIDAAVA